MANENGSIYQRVVENTLLDHRLMSRYLPLEYWQEYAGYDHALRCHLSTESPQVRVLLPIHRGEVLLPLVSLLVWAKAGQLLSLLGHGPRLTVDPVWCDDVTHDQDSLQGRRRIEEVIQLLGVQCTDRTVTELIDLVDADKHLSTAVVGLFEEYKARSETELGQMRTRSLIETICCVAVCAAHPGSLVLCGQDQAPLLNVIWRDLSKRLDRLWPSLPIGLYLPMMPFQGKSHIFLGDGIEELELKLRYAMRTLGTRARQLEWAQDLIALIPGQAEIAESTMTEAAQATSSAGAAAPLARYISQWMTALTSQQSQPTADR